MSLLTHISLLCKNSEIFRNNRRGLIFICIFVLKWGYEKSGRAIFELHTPIDSGGVFKSYHNGDVVMCNTALQNFCKIRIGKFFLRKVCNFGVGEVIRGKKWEAERGVNLFPIF